MSYEGTCLVWDGDALQQPGLETRAKAMGLPTDCVQRLPDATSSSSKQAIRNSLMSSPSSVPRAGLFLVLLFQMAHAVPAIPMPLCPVDEVVAQAGVMGTVF